jgi:hypothetical protein
MHRLETLIQAIPPTVLAAGGNANVTPAGTSSLLDSASSLFTPFVKPSHAISSGVPPPSLHTTPLLNPSAHFWGIKSRPNCNWARNQMECEMHSHLEPVLTIDADVLANFEEMLKLDSGGSGPYFAHSPPIILESVLATSSPIPSLGASTSSSPSFSPSPLRYTPAHSHRPRVMPSICIGGKLDKGKARCSSFSFRIDTFR